MKLKLKFAALAVGGIVATAAAGGIAMASMDRDPGPFGRADLNHDGTITRAEWMRDATTRFQELDANKDGKLVEAELPRRPHGPPHGPHGPGGPGGRDFRGGDGDRGMGPPPPPPAPDDGNATAARIPGK